MIELKIQTNNKKLTEESIKNVYQKKVNKIYKGIESKTSLGSQFTGWLNYTLNYDEKILNLMLQKKQQWEQSKVKKVVVIGIGGSYLGIKAAIDMVNLPYTKLPYEIIFVNNFNSNYLLSVLNYIGDEKFAIVVISKSGSTLEPAIAFNLFRRQLENNVTALKAKDYIVAIADSKVGKLNQLAVSNQYTMFYIPDDIGGRYSTLTPVGMFVMILAQLDYRQIIKGANQALVDLKNTDLMNNSAFMYACIRHYLHTKKHKQIENFVVYDPSLVLLSEQWKQLFGESEGKQHKAMYPTISLFTTDLHAIGQYLQEGTRNFIETTLHVKHPLIDQKLRITSDEDGLKYINNKTLNEINEIAFNSTIKAHCLEANVDNLIINIDKRDEFNYGYLFIWLSNAAMMSAYLLKLNPFDQPGVEAYKKRIQSVLKK